MKQKLLNLKDKVLSFQYAYLALAFLIPAFIFWLIYICMEVWPFGNNSVLILDLNGQYVYFFEELRNKLLSGGSFLYTWSRQLGGEFMGIFAYYLASPFSFLIALFPKDHITEGLLLIFLLKTGCMGATMAYYLHQVRPSGKGTRILIFSTCYALSSYAIVQAHNTMWIDNLILLPLLCLGIEKLIKEGKFKLYVFSLSMCLLTSFYIGYMACIFVALYFFYYYFAHNDDYENNLLRENNHFWKSLARIAIYSIIGIMIAFVIIYPAYTSLQFGKSDFSTPTYAFKENFPWLDLFAKLLPASYDTVRPEGLPFVYCGTLALILVPIYFCSYQISAKKKFLSGLLMFILVFSFNCSAVDIIWHGFQKPNWLNYRYSYMLIFIMLVLSYEAFEQLKKINFKYLVIAVLGLGLLIMVIEKSDYKFIDPLKTVLFAVLCLIVYLVLLHAVSKGYLGKAASLVLLVAICAELFVAGLFHTISMDKDVIMSTRDSYNDYMQKVQPMVDYNKENDDSPFYRMDKNFHRKTNDPMALGFYGMSNSSSTLNRSVVDMLKKFGYTSKSHWSKYLGGTPVTDSLFGMKYIMSNTVLKDAPYTTVYTDTANNYYAYKNPYALSLLYAVNDRINDLDFSQHHTPIDAVNALVTAMLGETETVQLFVPLKHELTMNNIATSGVQDIHYKYYAVDEAKAASMTFNFNAPAGREILAYFPSEWPRECKISSSGTYRGAYFTNDTHRIISLGSKDTDTKMELVMTLKDAQYIYMRYDVDYFFYIDDAVFERVFTRLAEGNLEITSFADDHIIASANVPSGKTTVFTTIPYDEGWIVKVDGKEVKTAMTIDCLMSFPITEGEHEVELVYLPDCIVYGRIISIAGLILFGGAIALEVLRNRRRKRAVPAVAAEAKEE